MPPTRRLADEPSERHDRPPEPAPAEPAVLALQRSAGNAAVTRLLALVEAVKDAVEKAQKSAAQAKKPGWRVGVDIKGDGSGGISGGITLTWTW